MSTELGVRAARKQLTTREIIMAAFALFARQGYDETTVEQIADQVGISKRTFFRYFANKEDLVLGNLDHTAIRLELAMKERPPAEHAWLSLRRSFDFFVEATTEEPERVCDNLRVMATSPALKATQLGKLQRWQSAIVPELTRRLAGEEPFPQMRAGAMAGSALACLDAAMDAWYLHSGMLNLGPMLDAAMESVAPLHEFALQS
ncbi:MAG: TetR family transcriptional regulator [Actinomycetota bacterium]|nr:TetR family transcriptional regulator [Actinomycetota bacterium]